MSSRISGPGVAAQPPVAQHALIPYLTVALLGAAFALLEALDGSVRQAVSSGVARDLGLVIGAMSYIVLVLLEGSFSPKRGHITAKRWFTALLGIVGLLLTAHVPARSGRAVGVITIGILLALIFAATLFVGWYRGTSSAQRTTGS